MTRSISPRDSLLREIIANGISHGTPERPIVSRDGRTGTRWVMSFLGVGLREPWLSIASDLLVEALRGFGARQIATMGGAASSLLAGCVLRSGGIYTGLLVRPEPKAHGAARQIEGLFDPGEPVVIIDDAIGTGFSALKCARVLEAAGLEVEGVLSLVRFTYHSGYGLLEEHGFRVRALYDLYEDITPVLEPECTPDARPWRVRDVVSRDARAPDGLSPFALVRLHLHEYGESRSLSRPPRRLATDIRCAGGLWISLRERSTGAPIARAGVWRFDDEPCMTLSELMTEACWRLGQALPEGDPEPERYGIALSLMGALQPCTEGDLDHTAFGIVCRSLERPWQFGSALPRMPGICSTSHQLRHALYANGQLRPREPFDLHRHTVRKLIEPGATWPAGGGSSIPHPDPDGRARMATAILERARARLAGEGGVDDSDGAPFLFDADHLFLSVHLDDVQRACIGLRCRRLADIDALVAAVAGDPGMRGVDVERAWLQLAVLSERWSEARPPAFTAGRDALGLTVDGRESVLLPSVAVERNLDADSFATMLQDKAEAWGAAGAVWTRYRVVNWLSGPDAREARRHCSAWVAARDLSTDSLLPAARGWFRWLAGQVSDGTLSDYVLPVEGLSGEPASPAFHLETVRRLRRAAPVLGEPSPAIPDVLLSPAPELLALAHAHGMASGEGSDEWLAPLRARLDCASPRRDPIGYWRAIESVGALDQRAHRWRHAPVSPLVRTVRACADPVREDTDWLSALVRHDGEVVCAESEHDDTLIAARVAEALAGSEREGDRARAERVLRRLVRLSVDLGDGRVAVRASARQTGLCTEHTVACLAAYVRLRGARP